MAHSAIERQVSVLDAPLKMRGVSAGYQQTMALVDATLDVEAGSVHAIIGPNGSGKSTLLKAALGLLPGATGTVTFFGKPLERARRRVAYMPQTASVEWDFPIKVEDVVLMGTYPRLGWVRRPGRTERKAAASAMERVGLTDVADRHISALSGGQKQRVFVARTLAQGSDLLMMDEPFAGVDIASESVIRSVLQDVATQGKTVMIVHHDISSIGGFCDRATLLSAGSVQATGAIDDVLSPEHLANAYGIAPEMLKGCDG